MKTLPDLFILFSTIFIFMQPSCSQRKIEKKESKKIFITSEDYIISFDRITKSHVLLHINGDTIIPAGKYEHLHFVDTTGMILAKKDNKYGYVDINENILIPFIYTQLEPFTGSKQLALAKQYNTYGYINRHGETVIPFLYDMGTSFGIAGLAKIRKASNGNNLFGCINQKGDTIIPFIYENLILTPYDTILAAKQSGKWAFLSQTGNPLTDFVFDEIEINIDNSTLFTNGPALVKKGGKIAFYNEQMEEVVSFGLYNNVKPFNASNTAIVKSYNRYGLINEKGELVRHIEYNEINVIGPNAIILRKGKNIEILDRELNPITPHPLSLYNYQNGKIIVKNKDGKYALFSKEGKELIPFIYDELTHWNKYLIAKQKNKYRFISEENKDMTPYQFESLKGLYGEPYLSAQLDGKKGILDHLGNVCIPFEYDAFFSLLYSHKYENSRFVVRKGDKIGTIDSKNNIIIPIIYDRLSAWVEYGPDAHFVKKDGLYGIISYDGEIIIPTEYEYVESPASGLVSVMKNGKYGIMTYDTHKELLPIIYDKVFIRSYDYDFLFSDEDNEEEGILVCLEGKWKYLDMKGDLIRDDIPEDELTKYGYIDVWWRKEEEKRTGKKLDQKIININADRAYNMEYYYTHE